MPANRSLFVRAGRLLLTAALACGVEAGRPDLFDGRGAQVEAQTKPPAQAEPNKPIPSSADRRRKKPDIDDESPEYVALHKRLGTLAEMTPEERKIAIDGMFAYAARFKTESLEACDLYLAATAGLGKAGDYKLASEVFERAAALFADSSTVTFQQYHLQFLGNAKRALAFAEPVRLEGLLPDGTPFPAAEYKGKVLLVEFWEIGCPGCARELPKLKALHAKFKDRGFDVVGVSIDRNPQAVADFMKRQEIPWRSIVSAAKSAPFEVASHYAVSITPTIWLVGPDGVLRSTNAFPTPELDKMIDELLTKSEKR